MNTIQPMKPIITFWVAVAALCGGIANAQVTTSSGDFRIDIDIYEDENKAPINVKTIFTDGKYIEIDDDRHRITVMDTGTGNITILDSERKSRVSMEMSAIENQLNGVLQKLTEEERRKFSSNGEPTLEGDLIVMGNDRMRYKFKPITPSNPNVAVSYGDFANWSVRVNALFNRTPPFLLLRMQLNQLLVDQRQLPAELRRITVLAPPSAELPNGKTKEVVARMFLNEKLSSEDKTRVASVYKSMHEYSKASVNEFFR
jgi:hypothetical protein